MAALARPQTQYPEVIVIPDDDDNDNPQEDRYIPDRPRPSSPRQFDYQDAVRNGLRRNPTPEQDRGAAVPSKNEGDEPGSLTDRFYENLFGVAFAESWPAVAPVNEPPGPAFDLARQHLFTPASHRDDEVSLRRLSIDGSSSASVDAADNGLTVDDCLQRALAIFPDISHDYVRTLFHESDDDVVAQSSSAASRFRDIVEKVLSKDVYPKQDKGKQPQRKRKRQDSDGKADRQRWEGPGRLITPHGLTGTMCAMLKADFPEFAQKDISRTLSECRHFYQTFLSLAERKLACHPSAGKGRPSLSPQRAEDIAVARQNSYPLLEELLAARKRVDELRAERVRKEAEQKNLQQAIEAGETADCTVCTEQLPMNRQIHCNGDDTHFTCYTCSQTYVGVLVGDAKCDMPCPSGCGAGFSHSQLALVPDQELVAKLAQLQQEKDIRDAGMTDIGECPFCNYKGIVPSIEVDFEFRCADPECEKVSCRRCNNLSHIPQSCEEYANDHKLSSRHAIEEAMTAALIRKCNKCQKPFIKEAGCNKMTCPSCGNIQCYVCSKSVPNYEHFVDWASGNRSGSGKHPKGCVLYDDVAQRHEREVKEAETVARAEAIRTNPDVSEEDLQIKVPSAVKPVVNGPARRENVPLDGFGPIRFQAHHELEMMFRHDPDGDQRWRGQPGHDANINNGRRRGRDHDRNRRRNGPGFHFPGLGVNGFLQQELQQAQDRDPATYQQRLEALDGIGYPPANNNPPAAGPANQLDLDFFPHLQPYHPQHRLDVPQHDNPFPLADPFMNFNAPFFQAGPFDNNVNAASLEQPLGQHGERGDPLLW